MIAWRIRQFGAIARLTAIETTRQPVYLLVASVAIVMTALTPLLVTHTLGEGARMARDSGLAMEFVAGLILGGFAASSTLAHEIRRGTVSSVLSKPVPRELFFLAKYAGAAAVMAVFCLVQVEATILSTRFAAPVYAYDWWAGIPLVAAPVLAFALAGLVNYAARRPFASTAFALLVLLVTAAFLAAGFVDPAGHLARFGSAYEAAILPVGALVAVAVLVLTALAMSLATRLDTVPTLTICSVVFVAGMMSDYLFGRAAATSRAAALLYRLVPNLQHFWIVDALNSGVPIPWRYLAMAGLYGALYIVGVLCAGILLIRRGDVAS